MNSPRRSALIFFAIVLAIVGCSTSKQYKNTAASEKKCDWIVLFDGNSTDAWRGYQAQEIPPSWKVENGALRTIPGEGGDLMTRDKFESFELSLEWKISPGGNSGVIYHVAEGPKHSYETGLEMQVLDDTRHKDGQNPKTSAGALYALIAPKNKTLKPVGEWNQARLIVNHNHAEHWLNGVKVVEYELGSPELAKLIAESKFSKMPRFAQEKTGYICLQHHHDEVWYRNIKVRRL